MYRLEVEPRFHDTDCLGHVNHAAMVTWMEEARRDVFRVFNPSLSPGTWNLIVARVEVDYLAQCRYGRPVAVETCVERVGGSSVTLRHDMAQDGAAVARGRSVMVHFDYAASAPRPVPPEAREALGAHACPSP